MPPTKYYTWSTRRHTKVLHGLLTSRAQALEWIGLPPDAVPCNDSASTLNAETYDLDWYGVTWRNERFPRLHCIYA